VRRGGDRASGSRSAGAGGRLARAGRSSTLAAALLVMGFVYGPLGGWMPTLFPVTVRYTGMSVAFNVRRDRRRGADADRRAEAERAGGRAADRPAAQRGGLLTLLGSRWVGQSAAG
jgi:hypothetical protein